MTYHSGNELINPLKLFELARLYEGMHIADMGCGRTGHVVFPGSKIVGERGVVYAVDILKDVLESIRRRAAIEAVHNIETVWADIERDGGLSIASKTLDVVFYINVLFHFKNYATPLAESARVLKDKGRIVIVDWKNKLSTLGPNDEEMVDFEKIINLARDAGFVVQDDFDMGAYHRCVVLFRH